MTRAIERVEVTLAAFMVRAAIGAVSTWRRLKA